MADAKIWAQRVGEWRASGQTATAFAVGRGYSGKSLRWWSSHLKRQQAAFVRVVAAEVPAARESAIEVQLAGARVLVRAGFDRAALGAVLDVLRRGAS